MPPDATAVTPQQLNRQGVWDLLASPETTGTCVLILALVAMGEEVFDKDINAIDISQALKEAYGVEINEALINKLQALITALTTSAFYDDPDAFLAICSSLVGGSPGADYLDETTAPEMIAGILEVGLLQPERQDFAPAVRAVQERLLNSEAIDPEELTDEEQGQASQEILGFKDTLQKELVIAGFPASSMAAFTEATL